MPKQIGYAVVGAGNTADRTILPAFARAHENSRLVAVVAQDRGRAQSLASTFRATGYHLDEFRQCIQRDDVNAVYLAVPNALRSDYTVEAARSGVHVLCEKPMAVTADECRRMVRTCQTNRVKLMIAYRLHFQPAALKAIGLLRAGQIGIPKTFSSDFTMRIDDSDDVRLQRRLGGGSFYELGVSSINAVRSLFAAEPAQVMAMTARTSRRYGGDVDEGTVALIRFPDERLAHLHSSFGEEPMAEFRVFGEEGLIRLTGAYWEGTPMRLEVIRGGDREELAFEPTEDSAAMLSYFSNCILQDRPPEPSGLDGLQDVRLVEAIYRSARDGRPVTLPRVARVETGAANDHDRSVSDTRRAG